MGTLTVTAVPAIDGVGDEEAAAAAQVLRAAEALPMHYGTFHLPPYYLSMPDPEAAFVAAAERRGVPVRVLRPGESLELGAVAA